MAYLLKSYHYKNIIIIYDDGGLSKNYQHSVGVYKCILDFGKNTLGGRWIYAL